MVKSDRVDPAADLVPGGNGVFAYSSGGVPVFVTRREQQADMMEINTPETMQAAVLYQTGKPDKLIVAEVDVPETEEGEVLIQVCAFGLNRSEMFTRQGHSPSVQLPRILGIECVGTIHKPGKSNFKYGDKVATCMGGLGREFDGSYAEYTCTLASKVQLIDDTKLSWETLGALPELLQTAYGSLFKSLQFKAGDSLLIRGGTTSVGLAAASIAKHYGASYIASTTRKTDSKTKDLLKRSGADHVFIDNGSIAEEVEKVRAGGFDKVLELIGTTTLIDSLKCVRKPGGIVCMTGIVGNSWTLDKFNPMESIPTGVFLTGYSGGSEDFMATPLNPLIRLIESGDLHIEVGKTFALDEIVQAHECMEKNKAGGKIVVLV